MKRGSQRRETPPDEIEAMVDAGDWLGALCRLLDEAGATVTFSANCRSGFVGREKCNCWRCREGRGEPGPQREKPA